MMEQVSDLKSTPLICVFDAGALTQPLLSRDHNAFGELQFDNSGHPMLVDLPRSPWLKYLDRIWESLNRLRRHSHLTILIISQAGQLIDCARALLG